MDSPYARKQSCSMHLASKVSVEARLDGSGVAVKAASRIKCPYSLIWETLTDYDHLAGFIPGISESRVVEREGAAAIVHQRGHASFLFLSVPLDVVVESLEEPPSRIGIRVLKGNLKRLDGGYQINEIPDTCDEYLLGWSGLIEPSVPMPLIFAVPFLRAHIEDQFSGMVREIERRCAETSNIGASSQWRRPAGPSMRLSPSVPAAA